MDMEKYQVRYETAQEIWDYLEEYVWPLGGSVIRYELQMSETGHAFFMVTYQVPEGSGLGVVGGGKVSAEIHPEA